MARKAPLYPLSMTILLGDESGGIRGRTVQIRPDVVIPPSFTVMTGLPGCGLIELDVQAEEGRAWIAEARISERLPGQGVTGVSVGRIRLLALLERSLQEVAVITSTRLSREDVKAAAAGAARRRVSDERLAEVAKAFADNGIEGVIKAEIVGERQAFRLVARARNVGLIPVGDPS